MNKKIIIAGAGGIGRACGLILLQHFGTKIDLILADINEKQCDEADAWIRAGLSSSAAITKIVIPSDPRQQWNPSGDLLLDCTPGKFAAEMATVALRNQMHYANLTENVPATKKIYEIVKDASTGFALQTGLAPGFINQLGRITANRYAVKHPQHTINSIKMRVGSLSQYVSSPGYYAFIWNPMGVSTEYLNDSEVIDNYKKVIKPSLSDREQIIINGISYEADLTSGGAADLPDFYEDKICELNYKTIRYPGHFEYIEKLKKELGSQLAKESLLRRMMEDIPLHDQDRVLIYCSVSGKGKEGITHEIIHHFEIQPVRFGQVIMTAIQRTTAAALAQTAIMLLSDRYRGLLTQSSYPLNEFLNGEIIREHYGNFIDHNY